VTLASRDLVLVAASGLARETAEAVRAEGSRRIVAVIDDDPARWGTEFLGVPVLGPLEEVSGHEDWDVVLCAGSGAVRRALRDRLAGCEVVPDRYATVVHPRASVGVSCSVGAGSILLAGAVLTADARIGSHVVVMPNAVLTHDVSVADFATITAGVLLAGGVHVEAAAYLGQGCSARGGVTVGAGAVVGMGAVVLSDVPDGTTVVGVPARVHPAATDREQELRGEVPCPR
jgi:sugar O-acyltransferase (sialic acid O-acetyltransferase NeuD family)